MKKVTLIVMCGFLALVNSAFGEESPPLEEQPIQIELKGEMPEWYTSIREYHPNGVPKYILFYEEGEKGEKIPVKRRDLFENGNLSQETDLILIDENAPGYEIWQTTAVPHGWSLRLYEDGKIEQVSHYDKGVITGPLRVSFKNGNTKYLAKYLNGVLHGEAVQYHENGQVFSKGEYHEGKLEGDFYTYYDSGERASYASYQDGQIHGRATDWYKDGKERAIRNYKQGKLHSEKDQPASILYDESHSIQEVQNFEEGQPHGTHIMYHPNHRKSYTACYEKGKINGKELFFDAKGGVQGEGMHVHGLKTGKHFRKHENGKFSFLAQYDAKGKLKDKIRTFSESGQKLTEYSLDPEGKLHGLYLSWYEDGKLSKQLNYVNGQIEGEQKEYFPNGQLKHSVCFADQMQDGLLESWFETGKKQREGYFTRGKEDGSFREWFENGNKKVELSFKKGKKEGLHQFWNEEGTLLSEGAYTQGLAIGTHKTYFGSGKLRQTVTFVEGKKEGSLESYYEDGTLETVQNYQNDLLEGESKLFSPDGSVAAVRTYKKNRPVGTHKLFFQSSEKGKEGERQLAEISHYNERGELDGENKTFYPSGAISSVISYDNGKMHGLRASWDEKGNVLKESRYNQGKLEGRYLEKDSEGRTIVYHYENNRKEGPHIIYYPERMTEGKSIKALEASYTNGRLEGKLLEYNTNGEQLSFVSYKADLKEGPAEVFYPKGKLCKEMNFSKNQKEGEVKSYFENGRLESVYRYVNDELDGLAQHWNEQGVLIFEATYSKGKQHGKFLKFYDDGKPRLEQNYVQGKLEGAKKNWDIKGNLKETLYKEGVKI